MKKLFTLSMVILITFSVFGQAPQKMSYQAVIRNASGVLVTNQAVGMKISILQGSASGTVVFAETYSPNPQTNANGLVTVEIGSGTPITGTFSSINWAGGTYYLKAETDPAGATNYTIIGTSQLLSVPYALYSNGAESVADNSVTSAKILDGTIVAADLGSNSVTSAKITDATVATADLAANAVTTDKINAAAVTGAKIAQEGATSGQALKWNGTTWAPGNDLLGGSLWTLNGANIYYNAGKVGIGIIEPQAPLHVYESIILGIGDKKMTLFTSGTGEDIASTNTLHFNYSNNQNVSIGESGTSNLFISGKVGIGTTSPTALLHTQGTGTGQGNVVFVGQNKSPNPGDPPVSGAGTRMMWYPDKAAFRAGFVLGSQWDVDQIGMGSTATGGNAIASGMYSTSMGYGNLATGGTSVAMGDGTTAAGYYSTALCSGTTATAYCSTAIGRHNVGGGSIGAWVLTDPIFEIGNGLDSYSNAMTVLKNGYVGLGTTTPSAGLHIKANTWPGSFVYLEAGAGQDAGMRLYEGSDLKWHIYNDASVGGLIIQNYGLDIALFCQQSNSNVGIGTTTPTYKLTVNGTAWCSSGAWTGSDIRWKKNIKDLNNSLSGILELKAVNYDLRIDEFPEMGFETGTQIGLIAQDVEKVFPELVRTDINGYKAVSYEKLTVVLIEGMKEQQKQIEELKQLVNSLMQK